MKKDFQPEQMPNSEPQPIVLPTATDSAKPHVVRSPNILSNEEEADKINNGTNQHGRFVIDKNGEVIGVEMVTLPITNDVLIPTNNKAR